MILSNSLEIWFVIIFLILITLFMFFFYMARKKRKMLVQSGNYITNYYNKHPDEWKNLTYGSWLHKKIVFFPLIV